MIEKPKPLLVERLRDERMSSPFKIKELSKSEWTVLNNKAIASANNYKRKEVVSGDILEYFIKQQAENNYLPRLIEGIINLINLIVTESAQDPYSSLIFLDKSARLGWYLFHCMWQELLASTNTLPPLPTVRFINYGREKKDTIVQNSTPIKDPLELFGFDQLGKTLVIDDFVLSGASIMGVIDGFNNPEFLVDGVSLFDIEPPWYEVESVNGVRDVDTLNMVRFIASRSGQPNEIVWLDELFQASNRRQFLNQLRIYCRRKKICGLASQLGLAEIVDNSIKKVLPCQLFDSASYSQQDFLQQLLATVPLPEIIEFFTYRKGYLTTLDRRTSVGELGLIVKHREQHVRARYYLKELAKIVIREVIFRN